MFPSLTVAGLFVPVDGFTTLRNTTCTVDMIAVDTLLGLQEAHHQGKAQQ